MTMGVGRPTVMTEDTLRKLDEAFADGCSDVEACLYADIATATLYDYQEKNPTYIQHKAELKDSLKLHSKRTVGRKVRGGDLHTAQWYLEKRDRDFNPKQEVDVTSGGEKILGINVVAPKDV